MTDPYQSRKASTVPLADDQMLKRRRRFWLRAIWISVAGVSIPPMLGLLGTVVGMVGAFGELSRGGEANSERLAGHISISLLTTAWGLVISVISFLVLIGALIRFFTLPKLAGSSPGSPQAQ